MASVRRATKRHSATPRTGVESLRDFTTLDHSEPNDEAHAYPRKHRRNKWPLPQMTDHNEGGSDERGGGIQVGAKSQGRVLVKHVPRSARRV